MSHPISCLKKYQYLIYLYVTQSYLVSNFKSECNQCSSQSHQCSRPSRVTSPGLSTTTLAYPQTYLNGGATVVFLELMFHPSVEHCYENISSHLRTKRGLLIQISWARSHFVTCQELLLKHTHTQTHPPTTVIAHNISGPKLACAQCKTSNLMGCLRLNPSSGIQ